MPITILLIGILSLFTFLGAKKGLVRTIFSLVASLFTFYIARFLAKLATPFVVGKIPLPGIGTSLTASLNKLELNSKEYEGVFTVLRDKGFPSPLAEYIANKVDYTQDGVSSLAIQVSNIFDSVAAYVLCFVLAVVLTILILALINGLLDGIMQMPILHAANIFVGGFVGFVAGLIICWLGVLTTAWFFPVIDGCFSTTFATKSLESVLYQFFLNTSPFQILL